MSYAVTKKGMVLKKGFSIKKTNPFCYMKIDAGYALVWTEGGPVGGFTPSYVASCQLLPTVECLEDIRWEEIVEEDELFQPVEWESLLLSIVDKHLTDAHELMEYLEDFGYPQSVIEFILSENL